MNTPASPRLAATVILIRDGSNGLELFMVARHHQIEFASGALVFPGGSVDDGDSDPRFRALADGAEGVDDAMLSVMVAAAREAFEECGALFARNERLGPLIDPARAERLGTCYRQAVEGGQVSFADLLETEGLVLALDQLAHFAHWVTPQHMPKRFDTHFFLAAAPLEHMLQHDGRESVESVWITPRQVCEEADAGRYTVLFPTRLNVEKIGRSGTAMEAIASARRADVVTVRPQVVAADRGRLLRIPVEAGYGGAEFLVMGESGTGAKILNPDGTERSSIV